LNPTGLVLGVASDWRYLSGAYHLESGDRLVFFTDGITEAISPEGEEFGDDRLIACISEHRQRGAGHMIQAISEAVAHWTGGVPGDDATLIAATLD
jgi:sigma-B regulation protein RsbU (phosphoserine phosphatase)